MAFDRQKYLQPSNLCDFDRSSAIRCKASNLIAGCKNREEKVKNIFAFVKEMPYGLEDWDIKASETLRRGWGMCSGKTNLLVALLRSAGIPARYRIYRIKADTLLWDQMGKVTVEAGRMDELGDERDHVDCEVWLGRWIDYDPGRDIIMERGLLKLGGTLERRKVISSRGMVHYLRLAFFDEWAQKRQAQRKFRSDREDVFAEINKELDRLRELGRSD